MGAPSSARSGRSRDGPRDGVRGRAISRSRDPETRAGDAPSVYRVSPVPWRAVAAAESDRTARCTHRRLCRVPPERSWTRRQFHRHLRAVRTRVPGPLRGASRGARVGDDRCRGDPHLPRRARRRTVIRIGPAAERWPPRIPPLLGAPRRLAARSVRRRSAGSDVPADQRAGGVVARRGRASPRHAGPLDATGPPRLRRPAPARTPGAPRQRGHGA